MEPHGRTGSRAYLRQHGEDPDDLAFNCSAYEYWMVASGKMHFIGHAKLMPWDHLAGVLAHQEAGGHTAKFDGTPYRPGETTGGIISAPDRESWQLIRREIVGI
jgi:myo-inositol-1(or 4)-monophosphatase